MAMNKKTALIAGIMIVFGLSLITVSDIFVEGAGEESQESLAPRYSETCAHGHNGFNCEQPQYRTDIVDLQKRVTDLENHISQIEKR